MMNDKNNRRFKIRKPTVFVFPVDLLVLPRKIYEETGEKMTLAEIVTLFYLASYGAVPGNETEPISERDLEYLTTISRPTLRKSINKAIEDYKVLERITAKGKRGQDSFSYQLIVDEDESGKEFYPPEDLDDLGQKGGKASYPLTDDPGQTGGKDTCPHSDAENKRWESQLPTSDESGKATYPLRVLSSKNIDFSSQMNNFLDAKKAGFYTVKLSKLTLYNSLVLKIENLLNCGVPVDRSKLKSRFEVAKVSSRVAYGLIQQYDPQTLSCFFEIYLVALELGIAQGPGWLVTAIKKGWDFAEILEDIIARDTQREQERAAELPEKIKAMLQLVSWANDLSFIQEQHASNPDLVEAWLYRVLADNPDKPALEFRGGLKSGLSPKSVAEELLPTINQRIRAAMAEDSLDEQDESGASEEPPEPIPEPERDAEPSDAERTWHQARKLLDVPPKIYQEHIQLLQVISLNGDNTLVLQAETNEECEWLASRLTSTVNNILRGLLGRSAQVKFITGEDAG
jgi:hypothetical protein